MVKATITAERLPRTFVELWVDVQTRDIESLMSTLNGICSEFDSSAAIKAHEGETQGVLCVMPIEHQAEFIKKVEALDFI